MKAKELTHITKKVPNRYKVFYNAHADSKFTHASQN